ncbi:hypothetical protein WS98_22570 [Burkholderia territorii]|uniref:hypothetical protein n=1 Tax=Burkholderia territorii TaxID=1503055 RepID=UPI0007528C2C|nr:hypothetical protein [Burkholderia territorii]KVL31464.1 hypothetical protein WS98_22570 [Burkholderia territorii]
MIVIFRKSAVDLRKNARDRARIGSAKDRRANARNARRTAVRLARQARCQPLARSAGLTADG